MRAEAVSRNSQLCALAALRDIALEWRLWMKLEDRSCAVLEAGAPMNIGLRVELAAA